ncbi:hypothetical protein [Histidinibacterium lentulum]|uniref:Uncharacterized protein n=1 Tax=Histidinibacterium lentulum TaxID=2480588 RepID=A0A3N2QY45_9RHOB|nr:hypothetical protein [Histidinibacterium lentulum]ROU00145.1 hypothetical protein EAT49_12620 [Histidinibacterium lentulum]
MGPDGARTETGAGLPRGDVILGQVADLDPLRHRVLRLARLWQSGDSGRDHTTTEIAESLSPAAAEQAVEALGSIWVLLAWVGRRRLHLNPPGDTRLSADEVWLGTLVAAAAGGARAEAMLLAALMVRAEAAADLVAAAESFGTALARMDGAGAAASP